VRITVFGAAGRTGRRLVEQALDRGHEVTALVRSTPEPPFDDRVRLLRGDARDADAVRGAIQSAEAVVSVLAIPASEEPTTALSDATSAIAQGMTATGVRRLVLTANAEVFTDRKVPAPFRVVAEEHRRNLAALRATSLVWTMLAPPLLTDDDPVGSYRAVVGGKAPGRSITRADLASAVLDALEREDWIGHPIGVADPDT
jgi:putative NADH-flavin reductase